MKTYKHKYNEVLANFHALEQKCEFRVLELEKCYEYISSMEHYIQGLEATIKILRERIKEVNKND